MVVSLALALLVRRLSARRKLVSALLAPMAVPAAVMVLVLRILADEHGLWNGMFAAVSERFAGLPVFTGADYLHSDLALAVVALCDKTAACRKFFYDRDAVRSSLSAGKYLFPPAFAAELVSKAGI